MFVDRITGWFSPATTTPTPSAAPACPYDPTDPKQNSLNPQGLKPCCACPDTKKARDACYLKYDSSESEDKCRELVQSHLACMRGLGFKV